MKSVNRAVSAQRPRDEAVGAAVAPASGIANDRMLTRAEVAQILGISMSSVRRLEANVLLAVVDESGTHLHSEKRVLAYKLQRAAAGDGSGGDDGALASAVFDDGANGDASRP